MKITKERVEQILPQNIKETTLLSDNAKNVLAMMMHSLLVAKGAQDSGVLVISNNRLRALLEMNRDYMLNAIRELEEYELVTRIVGKTRTEGEPSTASEYHFNWDNIYNKPLKKKTSEELFSKFFKPSGTPSGTAITTTTSITNSISNTISNTTSTLTTTTNSTSIENTSSTTLQVKGQNQMELEKPNNYRDLMEYFKKRMIEETKDKNIDELNKIQESLKDELDEFNKINGYKNIYRFFIKPSMEKKKEKLLTKEFEKCITIV